MIKELRDGEEFFIHVNRTFDFLRINGGYEGDTFVIYGREENWVSFYNYIRKKKITFIEFSYDGHLDFYIETKGWMGWSRKTMKDYFGKNIEVQSLKQLAELIKENMPLMKELEIGHNI